jgi:periplasmic divalent cation tolerance protein
MEAKMVMIMSAFPSKESAWKVATEMIKMKIASCVQITAPVLSIYEWQEKICEEEEVLAFIKTSCSLQDKAVQFIKENHPYEVPEIIVLPVTGGYEKYIEWVEGNLK